MDDASRNNRHPIQWDASRRAPFPARMTPDPFEMDINAPSPAEQKIFDRLDVKQKEGDTGVKTPRAKKPRVTKPLEKKATLLNLMDEEDELGIEGPAVKETQRLADDIIKGFVVDDDGDRVHTGKKSGDAIRKGKGDKHHFMDNDLDRIVNSRQRSSSVKQTYTQAVENEPIFAAPETRPPSLDINTEGTISTLQYVSPGLISWLQTLHEYDALEIDILPQATMPHSKKHPPKPPGGRSIDILKLVDWMERFTSLDFSRAHFYTRFSPLTENATVDVSSTSTSWIAEFIERLIDSDGVYHKYTAAGLGSRQRLVDHLHALVCVLDFTIDKKAIFYVRFVYVVCGPADENAERIVSSFRRPDMTNVIFTSASDMTQAERFLRLDPSTSHARLVRNEMIYVNAGAGTDNVNLLRSLRAHYVGYYYHTPTESFSNYDNLTHDSIHQEFIVSDQS